MSSKNEITWLNIGAGARATIILWEIIAKIKNNQPTAKIFLRNLKLIEGRDVVNYRKKEVLIHLDSKFEYGKDFDFIALEMVRTLKLRMAGRKQISRKEMETNNEDWMVGSMLSFIEKYTLISFELGIMSSSAQTELETAAKEIADKLDVFSEENIKAFTAPEKIDSFFERVDLIEEGRSKKVWDKFVRFGKDFDPENASNENPAELAILLLGFSLYFHRENVEKIYWILDRFEKAYYEIYSSSKDSSGVSNYLFLLLGDVKYYLFKFI